MAEAGNISTQAPVASTQAEHRPTGVADNSFTGTDVMWILGFLAIILSLYTGIRKLIQEKKNEEIDNANKRKQEILDQMKENKSSATQEVEGLRAVIRHDLAGIEQKFKAVENLLEGQSKRVGDLNDRVVRLESHREFQEDFMEEMKINLKEINTKLSK